MSLLNSVIGRRSPIFRLFPAAARPHQGPSALLVTAAITPVKLHFSLIDYHFADLNIMCPRHSVVDGPLMNRIEVPARVQRAEVGPEIAFLIPIFRIFTERENTNITSAHQIDANSFKAMV